MLFVAVAMLLGLSACDWSQLGYGPEHAGFSPDVSISASAVQSGSLLPAWTATTAGPVVSSPAVAGGIVYVASSNRLVAYDATGSTGCSGAPKTCGQLWRSSSLGQETFSSPAVANGIVYIVSLSGVMYAFDATGGTGCTGMPKTCSPKWSTQLQGAVWTSPTVAEGRVYAVSSTGYVDRLTALDASNGAQLWSRRFADDWGYGNYTQSSPAVANGVVYEGFRGYYFGDGLDNYNARVTAFDATGATLWETDTSLGDSMGSPSVSNGVLYADSPDGLAAFDAGGVTNCSGTPKLCRPLWTAPAGTARLDLAPTVANGVVYDGAVAYDATGTTSCSGIPKTCQPLWTAATGVPTTSSGSVANGVLYLSTRGETGAAAGKIFAFDASGTASCSGTPKICQPLWTAALGTPVAGSDPRVPPPVVSNGSVYVGSPDSKLYVFSLETAKPNTSVLTPQSGAALSGTTTLIATAGDNAGVRSVEFHLTGGAYQNALIGVAARYYGWYGSWDTRAVPNGSYTLNSVAIDYAGNRGRSSNVNITIQN